MSLDDLQEEGGSVLHVFGEDLEKVAILVIVDQDVQLLSDNRWHIRATRYVTAQSHSHSLLTNRSFTAKKS